MITTQTIAHTFRQYLSTFRTAVQFDTIETRLNLIRELFDEVDNLESAVSSLISKQGWLIESNSKQVGIYRQLLAKTSKVTERSLEVCKATDVFVQRLKHLASTNLALRCFKAISYGRKLKQEELIKLDQDVVSSMSWLDYHCQNIPSTFTSVPIESHPKFFEIKADLVANTRGAISEFVDKMCNLMFDSLAVIEKANNNNNSYDQLHKLAHEMYAQSLSINDKAAEFIECIEVIISKRRRPFVVTEKMKEAKLREIEARENANKEPSFFLT